MSTRLASGQTIEVAWHVDMALPTATPTTASASRYMFFCGVAPGTGTDVEAAYTTTMASSVSAGAGLTFTAIDYGTDQAATRAVDTLGASFVRCRIAPDGTVLAFTVGPRLNVGDGATIYWHEGTFKSLAYAIGIGRVGSRVSVVVHSAETPSLSPAVRARFTETVAAAVAELTAS